MVAANLGLGRIGSPRSRIAAIRLAAMSRAPRSSGMRISVGEQKEKRQPGIGFGREVVYLSRYADPYVDREDVAEA